jgi:hypothetical protein
MTAELDDDLHVGDGDDPMDAQHSRITSQTSIPPDVLAAFLVALPMVAFVISGTQTLLGVSVLGSTVAGLYLRTWRFVALVPAIGAALIWSLLVPAVASGQSLMSLAGWAAAATLVACPLPAVTAALGTAAGRIATHAGVPSY